MRKNGTKLTDEERVLELAAELGISEQNPATCRQVRKSFSPELGIRHKTVRRIFRKHGLMTVHEPNLVAVGD